MKGNVKVLKVSPFGDQVDSKSSSHLLTHLKLQCIVSPPPETSLHEKSVNIKI